MSKGMAERLTEIKSALEEIERDLEEGGGGRGGGIGREGLEDFKAAVDHIRLSVWAMLTAAQPDDQDGPARIDTKQFVARFRLSRADKICREVLADITAGLIRPGSPDLNGLHETLTEATEQVGRFIRSAE